MCDKRCRFVSVGENPISEGFPSLPTVSAKLGPFYGPPLPNGRRKHEAEPANLETVGESTNFRTRLP
jgi:hypothetical protein